MTGLEKITAAIAEKYAPAVDARAPYAKVMAREAAKAAAKALADDYGAQSQGFEDYLHDLLKG